jgi:hypothetical protein
MSEKILEKTVTLTLAITLVGIIIAVLAWFLERQKLTLTHLGSGSFMTSPTEEPIFEYTRTEPFTFTGYVNLKNMEDGDTIYLRQYVKLAIDDEYTLYAEEEYHDKQKEPLINIEKLPVLKAVKITVQQVSGSFKYLPWEFYAGRVG